MIIETKYNVKDRVWTLLYHQVREVTILGVFINNDGIKNSITYKVSNGSGDVVSISETYVFDTKVDLLDSL